MYRHSVTSVPAAVRDLPASREHPRNDTPTRILEAAFGCIAKVGLARTTVEDVARTAGVSRQTVYRYFDSKDHLVMALVLREEERFLDGVRDAFARNEHLRGSLEQAVLFCLRFAREHPLLDRLLETDSEILLPLLTTRSTPIIDHASDVLAQQIRAKAWVRADLLDAVAETLTRTVLSQSINPSRVPPDRIARGLAITFTIALTGAEGPAGKAAG